MPRGRAADAAGTSSGTIETPAASAGLREKQEEELGRLIRKAVRLLDDADLKGASEALEKAAGILSTAERSQPGGTAHGRRST
jgi:hypothetical protein